MEKTGQGSLRWESPLLARVRARAAMEVRGAALAVETAQGYGVGEKLDEYLLRAAGWLRRLSGRVLGCACTADAPDECSGATSTPRGRWSLCAECTCACHGPQPVDARRGAGLAS